MSTAERYRKASFIRGNCTQFYVVGAQSKEQGIGDKPEEGSGYQATEDPLRIC
jgi:hypothetical protein